MVQPNAVTREEFAELRADVRSLVEKFDRLSVQLEPLVLSRSGEQQRLLSIEGDVQAAHAKIRENVRAIGDLGRDVEALGREQSRAKWVIGGALGALQLVLTLLLSSPGRALLAHIFGGG